MAALSLLVAVAAGVGAIALRHGETLPGHSRPVLEHDWPGNLRELSNFAQQVAMGWTEAGEAPIDDDQSLADRVRAYEAELIRECLRTRHGDVREAARALKIPRKTLYDKLTKHGVHPGKFRE